ncbi:MAG: helix-turn-helix transcriptional regulator [Dehalococcoidales bacterium]|nr:helix-turn-helix transcriptional regulator [Dehalococcoidales bacterium]
MSQSRYQNLAELAKAMGISLSQVYRVREGKRRVNQKFIVGAMRAFPGYKLDELFYLVADKEE